MSSEPVADQLFGQDDKDLTLLIRIYPTLRFYIYYESDSLFRKPRFIIQQ